MRRLAITIATLVGCGSPTPPEPPAASGERSSATVSRVELSSRELADVSGLSGMTRESGGRLWAVTERRALLVSFDLDGGAIRKTPIAALPVNTDLESLTYLGDGRFAAGGENRESTGHDEVMLIRVGAGGAVVDDTLPLEYQRWGSSGVGNQGIEGLCAANNHLVAAIEATIGVGDDRAAPLALIDLTSRAVVALKLQLTSPTGKISALDCSAVGSRITVLAIERHFDVARVLRFSLDTRERRDGVVIVPELVLDWASEKRARDNPEGLVRLDDGNLAIVLDNDFGGAEGPNTMLHLRL